MKFELLKRMIRALPDKFRMKLLVMCAMESALVRPGQTIEFRLTVMKDGKHTLDAQVAPQIELPVFQAMEGGYIYQNSGRAMNVEGLTVPSATWTKLPEER